MSSTIPSRRVAVLPARRRLRLDAAIPWLAILALALVLPWLFRDWAHGRDNGFVVSMLSQMGMMIIFALSYNMLLGEAGLLSFGHAVFFGFGGYCVAHLLNGAGESGLSLPIELLPFFSGLAGLALAVVFGAMATKQRATAFAMITFGIGQLMMTAAIMFHHFFGGESGITTDRQNAWSIFGISYAHGLAVYYLVVAWALLATMAMYYLRTTPLGRMANACRDNPERAQFVGYDPRMVRFLQFALAGFFAGVGGGLYAVTYEIVTYDALSALLTANALLMAFIGGVGSFAGPILGAVLITLLQSWVSLMSNSWQVYVGVIFIVMVMFAPTGLTGLLRAHRPLLRAGRLGALVIPYLRLAPALLLALFGFIALVEMLSFTTMGAAEGKTLTVFGYAPNVRTAGPWLVAALCLLLGGAWLRREGRRFHLVWEAETSAILPAGSR